MGFSLIELFISLAIGVVLFAGVISVFVGMRTTSHITSSYGNMQETGRFTISLLTDDLMRQGYWGDLVTPLSSNILMGITADVVENECVGGGLNNGTFPTALGNFRTLWGITAANASPIACLNDAKVGSDILQLKRAVASPTPFASRDSDRYYILTNRVAGEIIDGSEAVPVLNDSRLFEYQHHIYYVSEDSANGIPYPVLNLRMLTNEMNDQPLIDGVEMIRFMYGIDIDEDGVVNTYVSSNNMTQAFWDSEFNSTIKTVRMYVLVRDIQADTTYTNNTIYQLGDTTFDAGGDSFRRMLFSSTITLYNGDVEIWQ